VLFQNPEAVHGKLDINTQSIHGRKKAKKQQQYCWQQTSPFTMDDPI
jgi:hypothetical protein